MTVADTVAPLVRAVVGEQVPVGIRCWDGSRSGPSDAPWQVHIVNRRGLRRLLWAPNDLGFARAYVSGDIDIEGDLLAGLDVLEQVSDPTRGPGVRIDRQTKKALATAALRLGIIGLPPKPPAEEMRRRAATCTPGAATRGRSATTTTSATTSTSSCSARRWSTRAPTGTPEPERRPWSDAQRDKLDLVCRKLGLRTRAAAARRRLRLGLDGAARGPRVRRAASSASPSPRSRPTYARKRVAEAGLTDRIEIRVQDYRDVDDGPYDAISSHRHGRARRRGAVPGVRRRPVRAAEARRAAAQPPDRPRAREPRRVRRTTSTSSSTPTSSPTASWRPSARTVALLEEAGFEVRDVESLREHYALTLRALGRQPGGALGRGGAARPARAGPGSGGCTWPARRWRSSESDRRQPGSGGQILRPG